MIQHNPRSLTPIRPLGLTMDDWDEFEHIMLNSTNDKEKKYYRCRIDRYLIGCVTCPTCPGNDPFQ